MKYLLLSAAVLCLAANGCAGLACRDCGGQAGHVTRSQVAPRPTILRTTYQDGSTSLLGRHQQCSLLGKLRGDTNSCSDCGAGDCELGSCGAGDCGTGYCDSGTESCETGGSCYDSQGNGDPRCGLCGGAGCRECRLGKALCPHSGGYPERTMFNPGPPVGQVAYPYYTVRGPRDFLQDNPPSIGPY